MRIGWHEPLERSEQSLIAFAQQRLVTALLQDRRHTFDHLYVVARTERVFPLGNTVRDWV
ncbi:hypothetical protein ATY30_02540 [Sinorhizobium americanum]|uniref:Uncharacterized protein n=1 Tax=Sinorhizobium americanum TaxID=194963 RepID=A0A2S3YN96_9HYPH|nr:hypothetical protein ATY31_14775 [Sinorhizobium americanum]POH33317.1 hypothetical protein ATY30_02540 [Sinorhizobium americanum]